MKEIYDINIQRMNNGAHFTFVSNILARAKADNDRDALYADYKKAVGALKTARTASDNAYRALVKMVNALALVFGEKDYTAFIDYVNTEITHYKREVLGLKTTAPSTSGSSAVNLGSNSTPSGGNSGSSSSGGSTSGGSSSSDGDNAYVGL